ncbi:MAG: hypothetical protein FJ217_00490 [Ignavibacteria bacterium]|nr:hypothetical protein [Ignavibacteria bacterium]
MKRLALLLPVLSLLLGACRESQTPTDLREDELISVYAELLVMHEQFKASSSPIDSAEYNRRVEQVLISHGFTKEEFYSHIEAQLQSADKFRRFHEKLNAKLEQRKSKS